MFLCPVFHGLSQFTWKRIEAATNYNLSWSEETNTEIILMDLKQLFPHQIGVVAFNKQKEEPLRGADWEWWIGGSNFWFGMRVQAKRISLPNEVFRELQTYKSGKAANLQIDTLIKEARRDNLVPVYCMYVFSRMNSNLAPNGCWVGHAEQIKKNGSDELSKLLPILMPWQRLVCPSDNKPHQPLGKLGYDAFQELKSPSFKGEESKKEDILIPEPKSSPPDYIKILMHMSSDSRSIDSTALYKEAKAEERQISGLIYIKDKPIS